MASSTPPRPEPVTKAGAIAGAVAAVIVIAGGIARALGWISDSADVTQVADRTSNLILGAAVLWSTVAPLALAIWARAKVTPLVSPIDVAGRVLQAVEDQGPTIAQLWDYLEEVLGHAHPAEPATPTATEPAPPAPTDAELDALDVKASQLLADDPPAAVPAPTSVLPAVPVDPDPPTTEIPVIPPPAAAPVVEATPIGDAAQASVTATLPAIAAVRG